MCVYKFRRFFKFVSDPTPRWNALRGSPEIRPYNSLPRGQDIQNYPSLLPHQVNKDKDPPSPIPTAKISPASQRKHSPARRSHSEDVYSDTPPPPKTETPPQPPPSDPIETPPVRVNPLIKFAERRQSSLGVDASKPLKKRLQVVAKARSESETSSKSDEIGWKSGDEVSSSEKKSSHSGTPEKRVSFDDEANYKEVKQKKFDSPIKVKKEEEVLTKKIEEKKEEDQAAAKDEAVVPSIELCDIEPLSGTVFRKVTVRRRRHHDIRKISTSDNGEL